eukprot:COSAG01_NODE_24714_length_769_cov_1.659701_1_plen_50_part_00
MMSEGVPPMNAKSAVPVAAPKTLRYEQDAGLPLCDTIVLLCHSAEICKT